MIVADTAQFAAAVPHGKLGGLDVGTKTIGIAVCDAELGRYLSAAIKTGTYCSFVPL